jgi:hypothetical protein
VTRLETANRATSSSGSTIAATMARLSVTNFFMSGVLWRAGPTPMSREPKGLCDLFADAEIEADAGVGSPGHAWVAQRALPLGVADVVRAEEDRRLRWPCTSTPKPTTAYPGLTVMSV